MNLPNFYMKSHNIYMAKYNKCKKFVKLNQLKILFYRVNQIFLVKKIPNSNKMHLKLELHHLYSNSSIRVKHDCQLQLKRLLLWLPQK